MIRAAEHSDVRRIADLAQFLISESPVFDEKTFHRGKTAEFLYSIIDSADGILLVADDGILLTGAMAGGVAEHPFSYKKYAFDYGLFVVPAYRGSLTAKMLVKEFERRALELGAEDCRPGIMTGVHVTRTTEFYERLGYRRTGTQLLKVF